MAGRQQAQRILATAVVSCIAALTACGTNPVGVDSCRSIEQARCENAPSCGIDLTNPVHRGSDPESDVRACILYYHDACLHGFVASVDPGSTAVQACVDAINNGDCTVVEHPETTPACAFLNPNSDAGS
ncbi:MAG: hypothetical protein FWD69_19030 [Polyangiaceae bacterium]|nr:hypothetical protein [Polyangiaceae bacterium]